VCMRERGAGQLHLCLRAHLDFWEERADTEVFAATADYHYVLLLTTTAKCKEAACVKDVSVHRGGSSKQ
jgi:hypothetical protein